MVRSKGGNGSGSRISMVLSAGVLAVALAFCWAFACPADAARAESSSSPAASGLVAATGTPVAQTQSVVVQALAGDTTWYYGKSSPYTVKDINQLIGLSSLVNSGTDTFKGKVVQMPDGPKSLAFLGTSIVPIGTPSHPFEGTFDGKLWTISNLTLNSGSSLSNIGLFGYAGDSATIKNLILAAGTVNVANSADGKRITNVGAIAGHLGGSIERCTSSVNVSVTNNGKVSTTQGTNADTLTTILGVGGLVGSLGGNMVGCKNSGKVSIASTANVSDKVQYIAGYVGGLAGVQGTDADAGREIVTENCTNNGAIGFNVTGSGGVDRFGSQMYSKSTMVGGIVGRSMASFSNCQNTAAVHTGVVTGGKTQAGWGASNVGGIVGSLRSPVVSDENAGGGTVGSSSTDPGYDVWKKSNGATKPVELSIERCTNTGSVTGLASIGGIAGNTGAFTSIIGCANEGLIEGTRWNKPCPAGIVGISNGDIGYCYNRGRCFSTTGGGYYASGIAALLTTYNNSTTADNLVLPAPEIYGCYITGSIGGTDTGYRTAVIAGENDGYIHDNCFLPNLTVDKAADEAVFGDTALHSRLVSTGQDRGTLANNHELSANDMKTSLAVSYLNKPYAQKGDWSLYYTTQPGEFPRLNWQKETPGTPIALSSAATGISKVENPAYSATYAPVPAVTLASGKTLYQDADYKVVVNDSARAVGGSYTATIEGINGYTGQLGQTVSYSIAKANIGTCTVVAESSPFNWEKQAPRKVSVRDAAGVEVNPDEYTWRTLANSDGSTKAVNGKYYDYINCHGAGYKYDIEVTAKPESVNYAGTTTQAAFRIEWASLAYSPKNDGRTDIPESAKLGDLAYGGQTWAIKDAIENKGSVKIKYTGKEIKPTFKSVTYKGREMRDGTGKQYYYYPLDYDYRYVYGNPNPEPGKEQDNSCINATGSKETELACVTVRFTTGGNFDNYTNVFYEITPASIPDDVTVTGLSASYAYTGKAQTPAPTLKYNGMTLQNGTDYTLAYKNNTAAGTASLTITGKGNYSGSVTKTFKITPVSLAGAAVTVAKATYTGKALQPGVTVKVGGVTLKNGTDYTVAYSNNKKAGKKAAVAITGKGGYTGKVTKAFTIDKAANKLAVKALKKTQTAKLGKKTSIAAKKAFKVTKNVSKGKVSYKLASVTKAAKGKITVSSAGKVTVSKKLKKGTYTVKVKVTSKATANYKAASKTVTFKVKVKK